MNKKVDVAIILRRESASTQMEVLPVLMYCSHLSPPTVEDACAKYRLLLKRTIFFNEALLASQGITMRSDAIDELPFPRKGLFLLIKKQGLPYP
jgi:hypothetical protein